MAKSERIITKRLVIEPFSLNHLTKKYVAWLNNPSIVCYSEQRYKRHTIKSCREYLKSFEGTPHYFWAISVSDSTLWPIHIGNITAYVDELHKIADIGILIGEAKAQGRGYATEAMRAVCKYLFQKVKIRKITAGTLSVNKLMLKLMRRVGMVFDGRRIRQYLWKDKEVDIIYGAIFGEKFKMKKDSR